MGILNVTPDSFSDGGSYFSAEAASVRAVEMCEEGASIIDVGGESTRPGSSPVSAQEEINRVVPVIRRLRGRVAATISVDTSKPEVMRAAVEAGAGMINDVRALRAPGALEAARALNVPICLMHMRGDPQTMQDAPTYGDVVGEILDFLLERVRICEEAGIDRGALLIDPGFGFGKTLDHNLAILAGLERFVATGIPVLAGLSRKSMIGEVTGKPVSGRVFGSIAAALVAAARGIAVLRVHDVAPTLDALKVLEAVRAAEAAYPQRSHPFALEN